MDLRRVVRKVVIGFILFTVGSIAASKIPGFNETITKGAVLGILILPPIYMHYNDPT